MNQRSKAALLALLTLLTGLTWCGTAQAYIGPGAGFAFLGTFLVFFVAIALAMVTIAMWPIRALIRLIYKRRALTKSLVDRVVVVGLDGHVRSIHTSIDMHPDIKPGYHPVRRRWGQR